MDKRNTHEQAQSGGATWRRGLGCTWTVTVAARREKSACELAAVPDASVWLAVCDKDSQLHASSPSLLSSSVPAVLPSSPLLSAVALLPVVVKAMFTGSGASRSGNGGGWLASFHAARSRHPLLLYTVCLVLLLTLGSWWWSGGPGGWGHAHQRTYSARPRSKIGAGAGRGTGRGAAAHAAARAKMLALTQPQGSKAANAGAIDGGDNVTMCVWEFSHYAPSVWESEWVSMISTVQDRDMGICAELRRRPEKAVLMVSQIAAWHAAATTPSKASGTPGADLMSQMHYKLVCTPSSASGAGSVTKGEEVVVATGFQLIEPLIGLLRDPLALCPGGPFPGQPADPPGFNPIQSKRFLLPMLVAPFEINVAGADDADAAPNSNSNSNSKALANALNDQAQVSGLAPWTFHMAASESAPRASTASDKPTGAAAAVAAAAAADGNFYAIPASNPAEELRETALVLSGGKGGAASVSVPAGLLQLQWPELRSRASPRVLLFDMGASYFGDWENAAGSGRSGVLEGAQGSRHFYEEMSRRGISFDHVWAYEYELLDPRQQWASIPTDLYADFTFVNSGVLADPDSPDHPWNTLLGAARPSDYVIVKLDIDTPSIEMPLMRQLMASPALQDRVDEMYFEHHVLVPEMFSNWGQDTDKLTQKMSDSYDMFTKIRNMGIRMHSWP